MARYYLKPIMWNDSGYRKPAGCKVSKSSYPGKIGFGHEEWNNNRRLMFRESGRAYKVFHTEPINKLDPTQDGQAFIFMIASFDGNQFLVGAAGNVVRIRSEDERQKIADRLKLEDLRESVWELESVRDLYDNNIKMFLKTWNREYKMIPSWICREEYFFWLPNPEILNAQEITGKSILPRMFTQYVEIPNIAARTVLNSVSLSCRDNIWNRLVSLLDFPDSGEIATDIAEIEREVINPTTREALVAARLGQGRFREKLLARWKGACAVTGCPVPQLLRASHIKPWRESNNAERLDANNGLLLIANIDALFDSYLISFENHGGMMISKRISPQDRKRLGIPSRLRFDLRPNEIEYISQHRSKFVFRENNDS